MEVVRLYAGAEEAEDRLKTLGLSMDTLVSVIEQVVAARADTISVDAAVAAGTQAYLAGVRYVRLFHLDSGFQPERRDGVEYAFNPETGVKLFYQSVDIACSKFRSPKALHKKGPASCRVIDDDGFLFSVEQLPEVVHPSKEINKQSYVLCVSIDGENVAAELSNPVKIENGNFELFAERIFIIRPGEWTSPDLKRYEPPVDDYDLNITRK